MCECTRCVCLEGAYVHGMCVCARVFGCEWGACVCTMFEFLCTVCMFVHAVCVCSEEGVCVCTVSVCVCVCVSVCVFV